METIETFKADLLGFFEGYKVKDTTENFKTKLTPSQAQKIRQTIKQSFNDLCEVQITITKNDLLSSVQVRIEKTKPSDLAIICDDFLRSYSIGARGKVKQLY